MARSRRGMSRSAVKRHRAARKVESLFACSSGNRGIDNASHSDAARPNVFQLLAGQPARSSAFAAPGMSGVAAHRSLHPGRVCFCRFAARPPPRRLPGAWSALMMHLHLGRQVLGRRAAQTAASGTRERATLCKAAASPAAALTRVARSAAQAVVDGAPPPSQWPARWPPEWSPAPRCASELASALTCLHRSRHLAHLLWAWASCGRRCSAPGGGAVAVWTLASGSRAGWTRVGTACLCRPCARVQPRCTGPC